MAQITLPTPNEPFVDKDTGKITDVWYRYLFKNVSEVTTVELTATAPLSISSSNVISIAASSLGFAGQAEQEAGVSTTAVVTPRVQQYHNSAAKAWGVVNLTTTGVPSLGAGYNISSVSSGATGNLIVNLSTGFSSTNYVVNVSLTIQTTRPEVLPRVGAKATTTFNLASLDSSNAGVDPAAYHFSCYGDQ